MSKISFNKHALDRLPATDTRRNYRDLQISNLYLRHTPAGSKTFYFKKYVNNRNRWIKLGDYPGLSPADARMEVQRLLSEIAQGNTLEVDDPRTITLQAAFEDYLHKRALRGSTQQNYRYCMEKYLADWLDKPLHTISRKMVSDRHHLISETTAAKANNTFRVFRAVLNFAKAQYRDAKDRALYPDNPADVLADSNQWSRTKRKKTWVRDLPGWFDAIERCEPLVRDYLQVLLMSGLRGETIADLRDQKGYVNKFGDPCPVYDLTHQTVGWMNKNSEWTEVPVASGVATIIERQVAVGGKLFDGATRTKIEKALERVGLDHTRHDLRRTFTTVAESLDIQSVTIKRLLGHTTQESDVTTGYMMANVDRLREAAELVAGAISDKTPT